MSNKLIVINSICFVGLFVLNFASFGQSADFYKQKVMECLSNHDCDRAQIMYDSYKESSKQKDISIEEAIKKCISDKTPAVVPPSVVVETSLEITASSLSFDEMGEDEKSVTITSNSPWSFLQKSEWVKAKMTADSTAINISCDPNISRVSRKDSIIIRAGDKEKVIVIEQSPVANPLLIGEQMMNQGQTELAEQYFQLCADSENPEEWNKLAKIYVDRGEDEDYTKALNLLQKSADAYNASGMGSLGYMYEMGLGTPKNVATALNLYTLSAELNYAPAQYNLGLMYEYGTGVKQDKNEALKWYEKAAKQGFDPAQKKLNSLK